MHWAALNNHVAIVKLLAELPEDKGGGLPLFKVQSYNTPNFFPFTLSFPDLPIVRLCLRANGIAAKECSWARCFCRSNVRR